MVQKGKSDLHLTIILPQVEYNKYKILFYSSAGYDKYHDLGDKSRVIGYNLFLHIPSQKQYE